jgi:hypothetical protein
MVHLESYDKMHIDVTGRRSAPLLGAWRFAGFYGESRRELRYRSWDLLKLLGTKSDLPWICAGDFNEVLRAEEQIGGQGRSELQMDGFRDVVQICGLTDLGYIGLPYTWDNRQQEATNVKVRLDRGLANAEFIDLFHSVKVWHIQTTESDHCCLIVECLPGGRRSRKRKSFRYENMWRRDPTYTPWLNQFGMIRLVQHLWTS